MTMPVSTPTGTVDRFDTMPISGILAFIILLALGAGGFMMLLGHGPNSISMLVLLIADFFACMAIVKGLIVLEPNMGAVFTLFGTYKYTLAQSGFFWVNPFLETRRVSLRVQNFNTAVLKVNDKLGNPIEIAAVITWKIKSPARAVFDVNNYINYIQIQCEMGLRDVASSHAYDSTEADEVTLRGNSQAVTDMLKTTVQGHVAVAGIEVQDVKLMHLAYAPEIANVMLRRQQASAIIQARELLVEGAVGMVKITLDRLEKEKIASLDAAARAKLVTSMMTVLLSDNNAQPVIQVGQSDE